MISDESDRFNPRDPKPADAGKPSKSAKRREARQLATQALYQWHMAKQSLNEIEAQFRVDNDFTDVDAAYFREILHGVPAHKGEIDAALVPCLDITSRCWRYKRHARRSCLSYRPTVTKASSSR